MNMPRRRHHPGKAREHHQRHDARLQQREKIADGGDTGMRRRDSDMRLLNLWQLVELMERRRRRQGPFKGGGAHAPGIVGGLALFGEGFRQHRSGTPARRSRQ